MGAVAPQTHRPASRWRRSLAWALPRPRTVGAYVWAAVAVTYATSVLVAALYETHWLANYDAAAHGAPIPLLTVAWTSPTGWLGAGAGLAINDSLHMSNTGTAGLVIVWGLMVLCGWFQTWGVWRIGVAIGRALTKPPERR